MEKVWIPKNIIEKSIFPTTKINIPNNIAIVKTFLPKKRNKRDKHLPYYLSSIWKAWMLY